MSVLERHHGHQHRSKRARQQHGWRFHPYELAICGPAGSAKTALVEALITALAPTLSVGYLRTDARQPTVDPMSGAARRLLDTGALVAMDGASAGLGLFGVSASELELAALSLLAADVLLVDASTPEGMPYLAVLGQDAVDLDSALPPPPVAVVHSLVTSTKTLGMTGANAVYGGNAVPLFQRDGVDELAAFLIAYWRQRAPRVNGLVLTGGRSSRMGHDKALLEYHGTSQIAHTYQLLTSVCDEVWVSCRPEQQYDSYRGAHPMLIDRFLELGPTSGILSALARGFERDQTVSAWLVLACDLPRMDTRHLNKLATERNPFRVATAFRGHEGLAEPLCAIWEPKAYQRLLQRLAAGSDCPRRCLIDSPVQLVEPLHARALENCNTPDDYQRIRDDLVLPS